MTDDIAVLSCGCLEWAHPTQRGVRTRESCRAHMVALWVFGSLHEHGGHEDCCDLPHIRREMAKYEWTIADLDAATEVLPEPDRTYARGLVATIRSCDDLEASE